jgi:hypothetical protein
MPLQYPLLFPYGERGFQVGVLYNGVNPTEKKNSHTYDNAGILLLSIPF